MMNKYDKFTNKNVMETEENMETEKVAKNIITGDEVKIIDCDEDLLGTVIDDKAKERTYVVVQMLKDDTFTVSKEGLRFRLSSENLEKV